MSSRVLRRWMNEGGGGGGVDSRRPVIFRLPSLERARLIKVESRFILIMKRSIVYESAVTKEVSFLLFLPLLSFLTAVDPS